MVRYGVYPTEVEGPPAAIGAALVLLSSLSPIELKEHN